MRALLLLFSSVFLVSCTTGIVERTVIDELRVLAMRADPPEVTTTPGSPGFAFLDALVVDPLGGGRELSYEWSVCLPDIVVGLPSCDEPGQLVVVSTNATVSPLVIDTAFLLQLPVEQQVEGRDLFVVLAVSADGPGTDRAKAFKRVRVSTSPAPNANPHIEQFSVDDDPDDPTPVASETEVEIRVRPTQPSRELYDPGNGEIMEEMRYSWWTTGGELEKSVSFGGPSLGTGTTKWIAESPATLWVVLRDPRGGVDWGTHDVVPP